MPASSESLWGIESKLGLLRRAAACFLFQQPDAGSATPLSSEDWDQLASLAAEHAVAGLIYWNATQTPALGSLWEHCPPAARAAFREQYYRNVARNTYWRGELGRIAAGLLAHGLQPIVLRGLTFLGPLYHDDGMRSSDDCDLCVRPGERAKVVDLLESLGYEACEGGAHVYGNGRGLVDLHTGFGDEDRLRASGRLHRITAEEVWAEAQVFPTTGGNLLQLSRRDSLLLNALHLLKHDYGRLIWKLDLIQLILQLSAFHTWPGVVARAKAFGLTLPLACAVAYAEGVLPGLGLAETVPHPLPKAVAERLFRWLRQDRDLGGLSFLILAWMTPRATDRVRFLAEALVPRADIRAGMHAEWEGGGQPRTLLADRYRKLPHTFRTLLSMLRA
jgi:hypothetical protein